MTDKIFKLIRDCETTEKQANNKVYVMINRQTNEIISIPERKSKYYTSIDSLYNAYNRYVNSINAIDEDNIAFREIKLADYDLSDEDNDKLMKLIYENKVKYTSTLFKQVVKLHNNFTINFVKNNECKRCAIRIRKSKSYNERHNIKSGYYLSEICTYTNDYLYFAETMPQLREILLDEVKKGNIEIPEAGLYVED